MGNPDNKNYPNQVEVEVKPLNQTAELYKNNPAESLAGKIKRKVSNVIDKVSRFFNLKKDWQEIKAGVKYEVNRVINGAKKIFSGSEKTININTEKTVQDLKESGVSAEEYEKTMLDYIKNGDEKWDNEPAWQEEKAKAEKELKLIKEKLENDKVKEWEEIQKNDTTEQVYDRLARSGHDKNKAVSEACINVLHSRNELDFNNPDLWSALEKLSDNKVSFKDVAEEKNSREIIKKIKEAVELIWTKEKTRQWGIENFKGELISETPQEKDKLAA